jgi:signal transduction histidine kinase
MNKLKLHGYTDSSSFELSDDDIYQLNLYAASDMAKRSVIGPFVCILGMLITLPISTVFTDAKLFVFILLILLTIGGISRVYILRSLKNITRNNLNPWVKAVSFAVLSNAIIWGLYLGLNFYLYGLTTASLIILAFTVAIETSAVMSIFIWHRLAQAYTVVIFIPGAIALFINSSLAGYSILIGLVVHIMFMYFQTVNSNKEYWLAICSNKLLENKAKELEVANNAKTEFLSSMSHELRTPLNSILGFSQLLETDTTPALSKSQLENVAYIKGSGEHLLQLINQLLELSKIEAGQIDISLEEVKPFDVINECLSSLQIQAEKMNINFELSADSNTVIKTDKTLLKQIILNLVSNAIKYNKKGGSVSVTTEKTTTNTFKIIIADTGFGIPSEKQSELFSSFSRLGKERSTIEGTGIGLTITKRIIDAIQGDIKFESTVDKGTTFSVELPV